MSKNPFSFEGKRAVVTGAATGVGAALIELLAELGAAHVTVLDVKKPTGPCRRFLETDLSDKKAVDRAIAAIEGPVHALFNNAGVAATQAPRTVLAVNVLALRRLSEGLFERMPVGAAIVNTASIAAGGNARRRSTSCSRSTTGTSRSPGSTPTSPASVSTPTRSRRRSCRSTRCAPRARRSSATCA